MATLTDAHNTYEARARAAGGRMGATQESALATFAGLDLDQRELWNLTSVKVQDAGTLVDIGFAPTRDVMGMLFVNGVILGLLLAEARQREEAGER